MLKKNLRLTKRGSFTYVYKTGERRQDGFLRLIYVKSKSLKIGFSVSNKIGKANVRNKVKRRLRAITREQAAFLKPVQAVVSVREGVECLTFAEIRESLLKLFVAAGLR